MGSITATNTPHQRRAGITDSADAHFEDLGKHAGALALRDNFMTAPILADNTSDMMDWLTALGVVFIGPEEEPQYRVARMHNVVPNSRSFAYHLTRHCRKAGVDIRLNTVTERILLENDRAVGVAARLADGSEHLFRATQGIVLASGDYSAAPDLKAMLASPEVAPVDAVNLDGHRRRPSHGTCDRRNGGQWRHRAWSDHALYRAHAPQHPSKSFRPRAGSRSALRGRHGTCPSGFCDLS